MHYSDALVLAVTPIFVELLLRLLEILARFPTLLLIVGLAKLVAGLMYFGHVVTELCSVGTVAVVFASACV